MLAIGSVGWTTDKYDIKSKRFDSLDDVFHLWRLGEPTKWPIVVDDWTLHMFNSTGWTIELVSLGAHDDDYS